MKFCPQCGTRLDSDAHFCVACGAKQPDSRVSERDSVDKKPKREWNWKVLFLPPVRAGVTALVALVMLIMAFLPAFSLNMQDAASSSLGLDGVKIKVSAVQSTVFLFDSLKKLEDDELYDSEIADELTDLNEDFGDALEDELDSDEIRKLDEYDELPGKAKRIFDRMMFLSLRIGLQSEQTPTPYSLIVLAIFSVLYLLLAIAALVFSVLHLLSALGIFECKLGKKLPMGIFFAVPMTLFLLRAIMWFTFGESGVTVIAFSGGSVTSVVLSSIVLVLCVVYLLLEKQLPSVRTLLWRIPAVVVSIILLSTLGGSVFNTRIKTYFEGKSNKSEAVISNDVGFFNELILAEPKQDELDEWSENFYVDDAKLDFEDAFEDFGDYTKKEIERGEANMENLDLLLYLGATHSFHNYMSLFGILPVLYTVVALGACLILWQNIVWLLGETYRKRVVVAAKTASLIAMIAALVMVIVYLVINNRFIDAYMPRGYELSIGAGVIASAVFALLGMFCPSRLNMKKDFEEQ